MICLTDTSLRSMRILGSLKRYFYHFQAGLLIMSQDEKSYLHSHWHPVPKCKCRECNTFAMVRIHVQMFQAMSIIRYLMTNVLILHYTSYDFVFQSWPHKNDFQTEHICVFSG